MQGISSTFVKSSIIKLKKSRLYEDYFMVKQGAPYMDYFSFRWWLTSGAIVFSVLVSLAAGVYPTLRAARVDPVVALRHD